MGSVQAAVDRYAAGLAPAAAAAVSRGRALSPALAQRLAENGIPGGPDAPVEVGAVGDLLRTLPILDKDAVLARQLADPPFGGLLADSAQVQRVFQSPGPLYEPQLAGPDPWRWRPALQVTGIGPEDLVLNCFGYHLSPAGAMFEEGTLALGARVLPGGIGNQDLQARAIADLGVTAYTGLPSYLKVLHDRYVEAGLPADRWRLGKALVTAEPLPDSLRELLQQWVPTVLMAYGTAEAGLIGYETQAGAGLVPAPGLFVQVCDLDTGEPIAEGEGQVVVTLLRPDYPLVRFGTGDLSAWRLGPDGELRLAGVLGRVGAAVKVRGMFLHPRQAAAVVDGVDGVDRWRFVIDRVEHKDELSCEVLVRAGADGPAVAAAVAERVRSGLRFASTVRVVDELPDDAAPIEDRRDWS